MDTMTDQSTNEWMELLQDGEVYKISDQVEYNFSKIGKDIFAKVLQKYGSKNAPVLEAGCGEAFYSFALSKCGCSNITCLDISGPLISRLSQFSNSSGFSNSMKFSEGNIFDLSEYNGKYKLVFNHGVYEHWDKADRASMLQQIHQTLSANGKYIIAIPNLASPLFSSALKSEGVPQMYRITMSDLKKELTESGFKVVEDGYLFVGPGFEQWLSIKLLKYPINFVNSIFGFLPKFIQKVLAAHLYVVASK